MLDKLSEEIREYLRHAEECRRRASTALNPSAIQNYLEMERGWLTLARSYQFTERLSTFGEPFQREAREDKETPSPGATQPIAPPDEYARLVEADLRFQAALGQAIATGGERIEAVKATVQLKQLRTKLPR